MVIKSDFPREEDRMTNEEAIYCMKSYLPDNTVEHCISCPYHGTRQVEGNLAICKSSEAHRMAIDALEQKAKKRRDMLIVTQEKIDYAIESQGLSGFFNTIPNAKEDALDYAYECIMNHINRNYFVYIASSKIEKLVADAVLDMAEKYGYKE